ncbi:hypothetical protein PBRA_003822, partial [Plasmodiophora brassicae]
MHALWGAHSLCALVLIALLTHAAANICTWYNVGCQMEPSIILSGRDPPLTGVVDHTWFSRLPAATLMTTLSLANNDLTHLTSASFAALSSLQRLYLDNNRLAIIDDDAFSDLPALITLDISHNPITALGVTSFSRLSLLTRLDMSSLSITTLPAEIFTSQTALKILDIRDNRRAVYLPGDLLQPLLSLTGGPSTGILNMSGCDSLACVPQLPASGSVSRYYPDSLPHVCGGAIRPTDSGSRMIGRRLLANPTTSKQPATRSPTTRRPTTRRPTTRHPTTRASKRASSF